VIGQRPSQRSNLDLQIVFFDDPVRPYPRHQLVFVENRAGGFDQRQQHVECAGTELDRLAVHAQLLGAAARSRLRRLS
jgi:hypothetical protein